MRSRSYSACCRVRDNRFHFPPNQDIDLKFGMQSVEYSLHIVRDNTRLFKKKCAPWSILSRKRIFKIFSEVAGKAALV